MKEDRFWKLIALSALALLAIAVLQGGVESARRNAGEIFVTPAHASASIDGGLAVTASQDGSTLYVWEVDSGRGPKLWGQASAD
jgi:hypothetical protein